MSDEDNKKNDDKKKKDAAEIRRRIKEDKIFNNGYKTGEAMRNEDYAYQSTISVNTNYSSVYLKDVYESEEHLEYDIGISKIFDIIESNKDLRELLRKKDEDTKLKLQKDEINWSFNRIIKLIDNLPEGDRFYNPIYILEALSSILNVNSSDPIRDYRKIFDCLDVQIQEELIVELNKKFKFLEGKMHKRKIH